ncbi:MAG TPA: hypothetical protein VEM77_01450 [Thermoplasmata archaeon]|nr:hypothetical protein [Thermoplasmata archaeon]
MADLLQAAGIVIATVAAVVVPFVVVPEVLERKGGYNPRSGFVRGVVWASFLAIVLVPAIASGFLFSVTNPADWLIFLVAIAVAVLYDYYRLNPDKAPWVRSRS